MIHTNSVFKQTQIYIFAQIQDIYRAAQDVRSLLHIRDNDAKLSTKFEYSYDENNVGWYNIMKKTYFFIEYKTDKPLAVGVTKLGNKLWEWFQMLVKIGTYSFSKVGRIFNIA